MEQVFKLRHVSEEKIKAKLRKPCEPSAESIWKRPVYTPPPSQFRAGSQDYLACPSRTPFTQA